MRSSLCEVYYALRQVHEACRCLPNARDIYIGRSPLIECSLLEPRTCATARVTMIQSDDSLFPYETSNLLLGRGGSGAVFLARNTKTNAFLAVKRCYIRPTETYKGNEYIPQHRTSPAELKELEFQNEEDMKEISNLEIAAFSSQQGWFSTPPLASPGLLLLNSLPLQAGDEASMLRYIGRHPHVIEFVGSYTTSRNVTYFVMELMHSDVAREMREGNHAIQTEDICIRIAFSVLKALQYIHSRGVTHRDVKPGNILLKRTECVVTDESGMDNVQKPIEYCDYPPLSRASLGDFSAAHHVDLLDGPNRSLCSRGTLSYKSPEQLLGKPISDYRSCDMWALGCTIFQMLTGNVPFSGESELKVQLQICHLLGSCFMDYPKVTGNVSLFGGLSCSPKLIDFLRQLLALDPDQRITADEAMTHPLFNSLRLSEDVALEASEQLTFPLSLMHCNVPESSGHMRFRAIAATPKNARRRLKDELTTAPHETAMTSPGEEGRPTWESHSFLSDCTSLHYSQIRSFDRTGADSSILADTHAKCKVGVSLSPVTWAPDAPTPRHSSLLGGSPPRRLAFEGTGSESARQSVEEAATAVGYLEAADDAITAAPQLTEKYVPFALTSRNVPQLRGSGNDRKASGRRRGSSDVSLESSARYVRKMNFSESPLPTAEAVELHALLVPTFSLDKDVGYLAHRSSTPPRLMPLGATHVAELHMAASTAPSTIEAVSLSHASRGLPSQSSTASCSPTPSGQQQQVGTFAAPYRSPAVPPPLPISLSQAAAIARQRSTPVQQRYVFPTNLTHPSPRQLMPQERSETKAGREEGGGSGPAYLHTTRKSPASQQLNPVLPSVFASNALPSSSHYHAASALTTLRYHCQSQRHCTPSADPQENKATATRHPSLTLEDPYGGCSHAAYRGVDEVAMRPTESAKKRKRVEECYRYRSV